MINAENPTNKKNSRTKWEPNPDDPMVPHNAQTMHLNRDWKMRPFINLKTDETTTLADITNPNYINQFWITTNADEFRTLVLRIVWYHGIVGIRFPLRSTVLFVGGVLGVDHAGDRIGLEG
jgi:hypothetical protein